MAAWREEDHPRDEAGRFTFKGAQAAVQRRRTVDRAESADESDLLDVYVRIAGKPDDKVTAKDRRDLERLDKELARRQAGGEQQPTPEQRRVDELLAEGASYDDAYRAAYGRDGEDQDDDSDRRQGETREKMRRRHYAELTALRMMEAEEALGYLTNKAGTAAGIDPASLFSGPEARARKWASEELLRWWEDHPRITYAEYRADRVGNAGAGQRARKSSRAAATGRKYGSAAANEARSKGRRSK